MRRSDKEIADRTEMESIIQRSQICRLGMCEGGIPYIVPLCFGYEDGILYFHSASVGKKLEMIKRNNKVCFEMDIDQELIRPIDDRGSCSMRYRSVIGYGAASFVDDPAEKRKALDAIMRHYSIAPIEYPADILVRTTIIMVRIESISGKESGY